MCVHTQLLSCVQLFVTYPMDYSQATLIMGYPRWEYWSELLFPTAEDLTNPGVEPLSPASPALAGRFFTTVPPGKPINFYIVWSSPSKVLYDQKTWKVCWGQRWVEHRGAWFKVSNETKGVPPAQSSFLPKAFPAKGCLYQGSDFLTAQVPMPSRSSWFFFLNWIFFNSPLSVYIYINSHTFFHHFWCQEFNGCFSTWNMVSAIPKSTRSIPSAVSAFYDVLGFKASLLSLVHSLLPGLLFRHLLYSAANFNGVLPHQKFTCWNPNFQDLRMWPDLEIGSL